MRGIGSMFLVALIAWGCAAAPNEQPSPLPSSSDAPPTAEPTPAPTQTAAGPTPSIDPELGVQPDAYYAESSAIGVGTLRITSPRSAVARWWIACEWSTTRRVAWLYNGDGSADEPGGTITLYGESVTPHVWELTEGLPISFRLSREDPVADYRIDPSTSTLTHAEDWAAGMLTFEHLALDPQSWPPGPLPTPRESWERPLGGDPALLDLAGSVEWECGPRPATVPTPRPPKPEESERPRPERPELPRAELLVGGTSHPGVRGCGLEWGYDGQLSGAADCGGPGVPVPPFADELPEPIHVQPRQAITFTLPRGFHFEAWYLDYVDQEIAEFYRGDWPKDAFHGGRDRSTLVESVTLDPPPSGDWMIYFTFNATDGATVVHGAKEFFRLKVG